MPIKGISFYFFLISILSILLLYSKAYILLVFVLLLLIITYKKFGSKVTLLLIATFIFFLFYRVNIKPDIDNKIDDTFIVKEVKNSYAIVSTDNVNYLIYQEDFIINEKDEIHLIGYSLELESDLELDVFEFKDYLNNKRVFYQIEYESISLVKESNLLSNKIKKVFTSKLENESYSMTNMLIFNDKYSNIDAYNNLIDISAVHLFVVSGFHISFFFNLIYKLFKKNEKVGLVIGIAICLFYVYLLNFSISATRALISLIISKAFKDKVNQLDCIAIPGILLLLIEPLYIYNYSFIMTFAMVSTIAFSSKFLSKQNKVVQAILLSLICFLAMIPMQLIINYKINFISLFTNVILSYVVMVIFVMCLLGMIISYFNGDLFSSVYSKFNELIEKISLIDSSIIFGSLPMIGVIIYYLIFIVLLYYLGKEHYQKITISFSFIVLFMICLYNRHYFTFYQQVTFLNVYQGDCCIILDSNSDKVMLIDTGGLSNYDIASKKIMPYLNYHGIRKIDIVVITHEDFDHCGALESLSKQIKIDKVIKDPSVKEVTLGKITLTNINDYYTDSSDENDSSIVLYGNICSLNFLFTGDISSTIESKMIKDLNELDIDVLKVAHHGSKYSTSEEFVKFIDPEYAIISVGKNYYGHPTKEVIDILNDNNVIIYRTDENGSIRIKGKIFDNWFIESAK